MKYYLISIQFLSDGSNPVSILGYDTRESVLSAFHSTLASNYANENVIKFDAMVITEFGKVEKQEYWARPISEITE